MRAGSGNSGTSQVRVERIDSDLSLVSSFLGAQPLRRRGDLAEATDSAAAQATRKTGGRFHSCHDEGVM